MSAGRKRTFDKDEALDKAMRVFWENGYSGTSISDLTTELGINKPSLYAAFGNKEQMFEASMKHYSNQYGMVAFKCLTDSSDTSLKEKLQAFYYTMIDLVTQCQTPAGCFFIKSVNESKSNAFPDQLSSLLDEMVVEGEQMMMALLEKECVKSELPDGTTIKDMAEYLLSVSSGLCVRARIGKSKKALKAVADITLNTFPCAG